MDLFELLFILVFFVLLPIIESTKRRGKKDGKIPKSGLPEGKGRVETPSEEREPVSAADMVPDDLWAILTGEKRPASTGTTTRRREPAGAGAPWSSDPGLEEERVQVEDARPWSEPDASPLEPGFESEPDLEPVSLEYEGPEAYSLEPVDVKPVSMERPLPSPEVRHRRFHEKIDGLPRRRRARRKSPIARALKDPDSLRQAFVLTEVLGPPKGLD